MRKLLIAIFAMLAAIPAGTVRAASLEFDRALLELSAANPAGVEYEGCADVAIGIDLLLPARSILLELAPGESLESLVANSIDPRSLEMQATPDQLTDNVTSEERRYPSIVAERSLEAGLGSRVIEVVGEIEIEGKRYAELLLFPVTVDGEGWFWFHETVEINIADREVQTSDLRQRSDLLTVNDRDRSTNSVSGVTDYLIVTSSALAEAMQPLVRYKNETGYGTELQTIEDILPLYDGRDDAERLREHLKAFYAAGGTYVLLAGDERVLPIRYAYHNNAYLPPDMKHLQICDLYFADLTGEWDADNDGVWGERYADQADLVPELLVGRLPINSDTEAANYIEKLIQYETDPGGSDRSFLERALFFSSDQMRDYGAAGQHGTVAQTYPDWFEIDTVSAVEAASGADPVPSNMSPSELAPILHDGFGIVNVIAHGRSDGFVLKSSGYNNWPKTYLLTDNGSSGHGQFDSFANAERPAFYYSLACDNGGFDMDQPPLNHTTPNVAQELIGSRGGAVSMVAYSRWGWISSSYILQAAFFDSLFAHPERTAVEALYASKQVLYYYRDLVYGLNYFGDPTLKLYTYRPDKPEIEVTTGTHGLKIRTTVDGAPLGNCRLLLTEAGTLIGEFMTNSNGKLTIDYPFDKSGEYRLTALLENAIITQVDYIPALITGVEDDYPDGLLLPQAFALNQNYPNPFNPSTTISFDLPTAGHARLSVFNVLGQVVSVLVDEHLPAGSHAILWDATDKSGHRVASGIYFYRLETDNQTAVRKMALLK